MPARCDRVLTCWTVWLAPCSLMCTPDLGLGSGSGSEADSGWSRGGYQVYSQG